jgi:formamidopyrimidine-DNA glycosylase
MPPATPGVDGGCYSLPTVPELPDVTLYVEALEERLLGKRLEGLRLQSAFLLRSAVPALQTAFGCRLEGLRRLGKRIVFELAPPDGEAERLFLVLHLMVAGRLHWKERDAPLPRRTDLAAFDFENGSLVLTESGTRKRASLHLVAGVGGLAQHDRGGAEPLEVPFEEFDRRLRAARHTLKRTLCDPTVLSGIGNAYSDEILHRARLSPLQRPGNLDHEESRRLYEAMRSVLVEWLERLRTETRGTFPRKVTAFRKDMAVHGRFGQPCPVCAAPVQRIVRAQNEMNYCAGCQTGGRILRDRALSVLLKDDWPATLEELE